MEVRSILKNIIKITLGIACAACIVNPTIANASEFNIETDYIEDIEDIENEKYSWSGVRSITNLSSNPTMAGIEGRPLQGSSYWTTSNIREWLNSNKTTVGYTNNPPSAEYMGGSAYAYNNEAGFLSNFTTEEQNAIAVTARRIWTWDAVAKEGGSGTTPHGNVYTEGFLASQSSFALSYKSYAYKTEKDKVFLLTPYELYWYVYRRNFSAVRPLTEAAKKKTGVTSSSINWYLTGGTTREGYDRCYVARYADGLVNDVYPSSSYGIVPAINIKPTYKFSDGRLASSLKIGDTVKFGRYLGEDITWQVINISDTGYPMLLSCNALDVKKFDAKGDQSKQFSEHISFGNPDVNLVSDVQYKSTSGSSDTALPVVNILNADELNIRQNEKFKLQIEVTDAGSGIEYIILPDGTKSKLTNFEYEFTENKRYAIDIMDKAGNYLKFLLPISNINASPVVTVSQSTTGWTNSDVKIEVTTSNDVKYEGSPTIRNTGSFASGVFPNYMSYVGKKFRVTGTAVLNSYNNTALEKNASVGIGMSYRTRGKNSYTYTVAGSWQTMYSIPVSDLVKKGEVPFDFIATVPNNYAEQLTVWCSTGPSSVYGECVNVTLKNLKYEAINDDSNFSIDSIELPNGSVVNQSTYTGYITEEGIKNFTYKVLDSRGKVTTKTITTKIDKTKPTVVLTELPTSNSTQRNFSVTIYDNLSSLKTVSIPGKTTETFSNTKEITRTFSITSNGQYKIKATDHAGNEEIIVIDVTQIDKNAPNSGIITTTRDGWGKDNVSFKIRMPHTKTPKILMIDIEGYGYYYPALKSLGYDITVKAGITDINEINKYDVLVVDALYWAVPRPDFIKELFDQGKKIITMGNDTKDLALITKFVHAGATLDTRSTVKKVNEFTYLMGNMPIFKDSSSQHAISVENKVETLIVREDNPSAHSIIKATNGLGGEWIHIQELMAIFGGTEKENEVLMGMIDDLVNYNDDSGISNIQYKIDDGKWIDYRGEDITVSSEGWHTVYAKVIDDSGKESISQKSFGIDRTLPIGKFTGDTDTIDGTVNLTMSELDGTISYVTKVEFSEDNTFKSNVSAVNVKNESTIKTTFTLQNKSSGIENFGKRVIYARITDAAGNQKVYSHEVHNRPGPPEVPTFNIKDNHLFLEKEIVYIKWTYKDKNDLPLIESEIKIFDGSGKMIIHEVLGPDELEISTRLPRGVYTYVVKQTNIYGESIETDVRTFRVNYFSTEGKLSTYDIGTKQKIRKIQIVTNSSIPVGTNIKGKVYYSYGSTGFDKSKFIEFDMVTKASDSNVLALPESTSKLKIEYQLYGATDKYISPELDHITVYAR